MTRAFDAEALRQCPLTETLEIHETIGSTNDRAKELVAAGAKLPALVLAENQTAGRGRGDHRWWASNGALTFSLALETTTAYAKQGLLALAAGLGVTDAVKATCHEAPQLKWPNDVLLQAKKLAGVLIESPRPGSLVVGVGVNVENRLDGAPAEIQQRACSLVDHGKATRQALLQAFLAAFNQRLSELESSDPQLLAAARSADALRGKSIEVLDGNQTYRGIGAGFADDGALLVQQGSTTIRVQAGSVRLCQTL